MFSAFSEMRRRT